MDDSPTMPPAERSMTSPVPIRNPPPTPRAVNSLTRNLNNGPMAMRIPPSLQAKMAAVAQRANQANANNAANTANGSSLEAVMHKASLVDHPHIQSIHSAPGGLSGQKGGLAGRRKGLKFNINDITGAPPTPSFAGGGARNAGLGGGVPLDEYDSMPARRNPGMMGSPFENLVKNKIVDPSGALRFGGKAILHAAGVDFSNGSSFAINMTQMQLMEELGKGNYGTVKKVLHKPTNVFMAMKEIRLELDDSKLSAILMELDILHRAVAPEIVEFYGAFFIESCVYYCMEYMDAGSLDKLTGAGVPEDVLARITGSMVNGLKFLKDEMQIIHRDVKPTNVLINRKGEIKLCDFGVSGQLEKSLAKTNIGCQSYMAPERIKGESLNDLGTYTVSSDVWSLGLSVIEIALGNYPYPPETYSNVFAQLTAIVHGPPPELPEGYSETAQAFVANCLMKEPDLRPTYGELLSHAFLIDYKTRDVDMPAWIERALAYREAQHKNQTSPHESHSSLPSDSSSNGHL